MCGLREGDFGDRGHDHAPQPLAPEDLVDGRYDLPWNSMRVEQRIGRIDRYGQASETVAIVNLVTPGTVDADIYERCLLRIGVFRSCPVSVPERAPRDWRSQCERERARADAAEVRAEELRCAASSAARPATAAPSGLGSMSAPKSTTRRRMRASAAGAGSPMRRTAPRNPPSSRSRSRPTSA